MHAVEVDSFIKAVRLVITLASLRICKNIRRWCKSERQKEDAKKVQYNANWKNKEVLGLNNSRRGSQSSKAEVH